MISIEIEAKDLRRLREATEKAKKKFSKELAAAINQTSKKTRRSIGKNVRDEVALKKQEAEKPISIRTTATEHRLSATVQLKKTARLGLRQFGAKQTKTGVSYRISKKGGRARIAGAFQGPKPGVMKMSWRGNVFKRVGKSRLPIVQIKGVSPYGVYQKNQLSRKQVKEIEAELNKQMERRIRLNILRAEKIVST